MNISSDFYKYLDDRTLTDISAYLFCCNFFSENIDMHNETKNIICEGKLKEDLHIYKKEKEIEVKIYRNTITFLDNSLYYINAEDPVLKYIKSENRAKEIVDNIFENNFYISSTTGLEFNFYMDTLDKTFLSMNPLKQNIGPLEARYLYNYELIEPFLMVKTIGLRGNDPVEILGCLGLLYSKPLLLEDKTKL